MLSTMTAALIAIAPDIWPVDAADLDARLTAYRWQARPILIFAEANDPRLTEQLEAFRADAPALRERENVVIVDASLGGTPTPLARRFRPDGFTVILVGKDGGEKLRADRVVDPQLLNDLIDTMPMRIIEMGEG
ncbi:MAG: DUF4174 domain-containing protein [Pseudomonadota bacterium]